jgi:hypothetical protein
MVIKSLLRYSVFLVLFANFLQEKTAEEKLEKKAKVLACITMTKDRFSSDSVIFASYIGFYWKISKCG